MQSLVLKRVDGRVLRAATVVLLSLATGLAARVQVILPFSPVPLTMQVAIVILSGLMLGSRGGLVAQMVYLQAILMGAPLTSSGLAGPMAFAAPTGGYLLAFPLAAFAAGWVAERVSWPSLAAKLVAGLAGLAVIYGLGMLWLSVFVGGIGQAWLLGVVPFIGVDAGKILLVGSLASVKARS